VAVFGLPQVLLGPGFFSAGHYGFLHGLGVFIAGIVFLFAAPWAVRVVVYLDRRVMRVLLAPDALAARVRVLERARAQSVDSSAATLRRIERDLHDGTQAQLVALAMRLGMAKEKLAALGDDGIGGDEGVGGRTDLDQVRQLVDDAHRGAKEAIVELRDLARGIHPPALDVGLEGALSTLAARSTVPTELTVSLHDRPTPAIEAIAYFCVAELLANVAQHAHASHAGITCTDHGQWLRVVVRDDGTGGAQLSRVGSLSSGLVGLTDRVHAVDGRLDIASPPRGPTVVTVDLPLHA
jgi:signal transduction histidine kinase